MYSCLVSDVAVSSFDVFPPFPTPFFILSAYIVYLSNISSVKYLTAKVIERLLKMRVGVSILREYTIGTKQRIIITILKRPIYWYNQTLIIFCKFFQKKNAYTIIPTRIHVARTSNEIENFSTLKEQIIALTGNFSITSDLLQKKCACEKKRNGEITAKRKRFTKDR